MALLDHLEDFQSAGGHFLHPVPKACFQKWAEELSWLHCSDLTSTTVLRKLPLTGGLESTHSPHVTQSLYLLCIPSDNCDAAPLRE